MIVPGIVSKTRMQAAGQPRLVEKATGQLFILVRDDTAANGKLHIAPIGMITSMRSIKPEALEEQFEWYVDPKDRPLPGYGPQGATVENRPDGMVVTTPDKTVAAAPKNKGGRPKGRKDTKKRKSPARKVKPDEVPVVAE